MPPLWHGMDAAGAARKMIWYCAIHGAFEAEGDVQCPYCEAAWSESVEADRQYDTAREERHADGA